VWEIDARLDRQVEDSPEPGVDLDQLEAAVPFVEDALQVADSVPPEAAENLGGEHRQRRIVDRSDVHADAARQRPERVPPLGDHRPRFAAVEERERIVHLPGNHLLDDGAGELLEFRTRGHTLVCFPIGHPQFVGASHVAQPDGSRCSARFDHHRVAPDTFQQLLLAGVLKRLGNGEVQRPRPAVEHLLVVGKLDQLPRHGRERGVLRQFGLVVPGHQAVLDGHGKQHIIGCAAHQPDEIRAAASGMGLGRCEPVDSTYTASGE